MDNSEELKEFVTGATGQYVLGKVADGLIGNDLTKWTELLKNVASERVQNINKIFQASRKKADQQEKELTFQVPARIADRVINEGSYCTQNVMQEYYAGVLLSSQGGFVDDEGVFYLSTIHRLSSIQLRAHYILYQIIKEAYNNNGPTIRLISTDPISMTGLTYIRASSFMNALYGENPVIEYEDFHQQHSLYQAQTEHILQGLRKENLVKAFFLEADSKDEPERQNDYYNIGYRKPREDRHWYIFFAPTMEGLQLFLWGQGYGKLPINKFLKDEVICKRIEGIEIANFAEYYSNNSLFVHQHIHDHFQRKFDQ